MSDFDWSERFPEMRPVRSAPPLVRINGIGCGVYGSRDNDEETGTYVTTYCVSVIFIPVLALTAYRVANSPSGGWYFLGRVPLSTFARIWNALVLLAVVAGAGLIGWNAYTHSLDYEAGQKLAKADELAANGQAAAAAPLYRDVATGMSSHAATAADRLNGLLDDPMTQASLPDAAEVYRAIIQTRSRSGVRGVDLEERGLALLDQHADKEPSQALAFVEVLRPIAPDSPKLAARRKALLERSVARDPKNVALASELALLYEASNQLPRCEAILMPVKDQLGNSEGARILGQLLARKDKIDDACTVLEPYTEHKLQELRNAEMAFNNAARRVFETVNTGRAPGFDYERHKAADKAGQQAIVREYFQGQIESDPALKQAFDAYQQAQITAPAAALDLGMLLLRRAQTQRDPAAREADLKKAEKTFLAIQHEAAAESNAYRLALGQVFYWLGKQTEGHKKFEEVLAAEQRNWQTLMTIAGLLREVGAWSEARTLFEEAYNKEQDRDKKYQAALALWTLAVESDEKITWLQRANPDLPEVKANLSEARGDKALEEGKLDDAVPLLREAIDLYAKMPETSVTLNNGALIHITLYSVTGDRRLLDKAEKMLDKAVQNNPQNSTYLLNAANAFLNAAVRDVIGSAINLSLLKKAGDHSLLAFLYDDREAQRRLIDRYRKHPATAKAQRYLERLLILAPKNAAVYRLLSSLYEDQRNLDKLRDLAARLDKGSLEMATEEKKTREVYSGKRDEKTRRELQGQIDRAVKRMEEASKGPRNATYAVAATDLATLKMRLARYGGAADADEIVKLAEAAYEAAPSYATRTHLEGALLFRAGVKLAEHDATYAALDKRTRRALSPSMLIALVLQQDGKTRSLALANADVQRTLELIREGQRKASHVPNAWAWAMLRSDEKESAKFAEVLRTDTMDGIVRELNMKLYPLSGDIGLRNSWALRAAGKDKEATAVLRQFADRGVPLP